MMIQIPIIFTEFACVGFSNLSLRVRLGEKKKKKLTEIAV